VIAHAPRALLEALYRDTLAALHPAHAVHSALSALYGRGNLPRHLHILAIGKASQAMAAGAIRWCAEYRVPVLGGLCVSHAFTADPIGHLAAVIGDHPAPGVHSVAAAEALGAYLAEHVQAHQYVLVLISGGASALIGAPRDADSAAEFAAASERLMLSGLRINEINQVRRRLSRWGGGRLGDAVQLRGARAAVLVVSDVIGDDLATIGSGPCVPDAARERDAGDASIPHRIISNNRAARDTVVSIASAGGLEASQVAEPLQGDVSRGVDRIVMTLLTLASQARTGTSARRARVICWGGEPTVTLPGSDAPTGGRMQALAMTVAKQLHDAGKDADGITLLAAGTDGRDGATDAAGAVVSARTWRAMRDVGRTPDQDLATFHSHAALAAVQALIPAFASGTNVNDLVIAHIA
jgi:glycerate 2-kinase